MSSKGFAARAQGAGDKNDANSSNNKNMDMGGNQQGGQQNLKDNTQGAFDKK
jgi:hypothetical protein